MNSAFSVFIKNLLAKFRCLLATASIITRDRQLRFSSLIYLPSKDILDRYFRRYFGRYFQRYFWKIFSLNYYIYEGLVPSSNVHKLTQIHRSFSLQSFLRFLVSQISLVQFTFSYFIYTSLVFRTYRFLIRFLYFLSLSYIAFLLFSLSLSYCFLYRFRQYKFTAIFIAFVRLNLLLSLSLSLD